MSLDGFFSAPAPTQPPPSTQQPSEGPIKTWSYSALRTFEACPLRTKYQRIDRVPRPEPPPDNPMVRGTRIHEEIENYIQTGANIPTPLKCAPAIIEQCREEYLLGAAQTELAWAFDHQWNLVDDPKSPKIWFRAILDVFIRTSPTEATVIDWKSGKSWMKDVPHLSQAQLYTACTFRAIPELEKVTTRFVYVDEANKETRREYSRGKAKSFETTFHNRGLRLTTATAFNPKPNQMNCKFCDYGMTVGTGHCPYDVFRDDAIRPAAGHLRHRGA